MVIWNSTDYAHSQFIFVIPDNCTTWSYNKFKHHGYIVYTYKVIQVIDT